MATDERDGLGVRPPETPAPTLPGTPGRPLPTPGPAGDRSRKPRSPRERPGGRGRDGGRFRSADLFERTHPVLLMLLGSACTAASGTFIKLSGVNAGTAAFLRCALALPLLLPFAIAEWRRLGPRRARLQAYDFAAGMLLGVDFVFWSQAIQDVGASIATVLLNVQVLVFPVLARLLTGVPLGRRYWLTVPVMLFGVALSSGAVGDPEPGSSPVSGTLFGAAAGVAFAGYLTLTRLGGGQGHSVYPVATSSVAAGLSAGVLGGLWTGIDLAPGWGPLGWLAVMAVTGQVLAWVLIGEALPRLAAHVGGALLLAQPVMAVACGVAFLGERPTLTQYSGCVLVVLTVWYTSRRGR
ncbi:DMT family transporter [Streptomyces sp. AJS327]|uniref:DMT family transporter n=1 Tax=Streptomyces sp. AJS327 TaxID=2545265 RepID=UPI0017F43273|nr:DMT family transporter [Streptomyces sp. AJS327]MBA0049814.1 DMT family transporter [Streptomyces sp. AJS327]